MKVTVAILGDAGEFLCTENGTVYRARSCLSGRAGRTSAIELGGSTSILGSHDATRARRSLLRRAEMEFGVDLGLIIGSLVFRTKSAAGESERLAGLDVR